MLTNVVAVLALVLSSLSLYLQWRKSRPALKAAAVLEEQSLPVEFDEIGNQVSRDVPALSVRMTNPSERPVHVSGVRLQMRTGQSIELAPFNRVYKGFARPFTVEPLRSATFTVRGLDLGEQLREQGLNGRVSARVDVVDEAGKHHRTKSLPLDVETLLHGEAAGE